jgi:cytochrome o ubiquinol oxidase subunit 2
MGQNVQCPVGTGAPRVAAWRNQAIQAVRLDMSNLVLLHPAGAVAAQQGHLIVVSTVLMLLVIVPVMVLTVLFAWRYRKSNTAATYEPDWDHSTQLELVIWAAPLLIIIALGAVTWISTHTLDPYRPLHAQGGHPVSTGAAAAPADAEAVKPLVVDVVALDWKWLFIYPEQGIAVVNDLAAPVDTPVTFRITASSVMNSFFIPSLAGQIYAMPGMQTELHAIMNRSGDYDGFSANYSGAGFSDMRFKFHSLSAGEFDRWVQSAKDSGRALDREQYLQLARPSEREPVRRYAQVSDGLYDSILAQTVVSNNVR